MGADERIQCIVLSNNDFISEATTSSFRKMADQFFVFGNGINVFEGSEIEMLELNGQILFNPYDVGKALDIKKQGVRKNCLAMDSTQCIMLYNDDFILEATNSSFRKLNNRGEYSLTESGVYQFILQSYRPVTIVLKNWVTDDELPTIRRTGEYVNNTNQFIQAYFGSLENSVRGHMNFIMYF